MISTIISIFIFFIVLGLCIIGYKEDEKYQKKFEEIIKRYENE